MFCNNGAIQKLIPSTSSVYPSGGALATISPTRFADRLSTTNDCPRTLVSSCATRRAAKSPPLPTSAVTMRTGRLGYVWAQTALAPAINCPASNTHKTNCNLRKPSASISRPISNGGHVGTLLHCCYLLQCEPTRFKVSGMADFNARRFPLFP